MIRANRFTRIALRIACATKSSVSSKEGVNKVSGNVLVLVISGFSLLFCQFSSPLSGFWGTARAEGSLFLGLVSCFSAQQAWKRRTVGGEESRNSGPLRNRKRKPNMEFGLATAPPQSEIYVEFSVFSHHF